MNKSMLYHDNVFQKYEISNERNAHLKKLQNIEKRIKISSPSTHPKSKNKKDLLTQERYKQIEKDNKLLLSKILTINYGHTRNTLRPHYSFDQTNSAAFRFGLKHIDNVR